MVSWLVPPLGGSGRWSRIYVDETPPAAPVDWPGLRYVWTLDGGVQSDHFDDPGDDVYGLSPPPPPPPPGGERAWLLQGGVDFNSFQEVSDRYYSNKFKSRTAHWTITSPDAVADGFPSGVYPTWWLVKEGFLNADGDWITDTFPSGTTEVRSGLMLQIREGAGSLDEEDQIAQYLLGTLWEFTWEGGNGTDFQIPASTNGANVLVNTTRRIIHRISTTLSQAENDQPIYMRAKLAGGAAMSTVRNLRLRQVIDEGGGVYTPVETGEVSQPFLDGTAFYDVIRFMDHMGNNYGSIRSLSQLNSYNSSWRGGMTNEGGTGYLNAGPNLRELLENTDASDQIAWLTFPTGIGSPVPMGWLYHAVSAGTIITRSRIGMPTTKPNSFAVVSASEYGIGVFDFTEFAESGYFTWTSNGETLVNGGEVGFEFTYEDEDDNAIGPCTFNFAIGAGGSSFAYPPAQGNSEAQSSFYNAAIIKASPEWQRAAVIIVDDLVASGYPTDKLLIFELSNEPWNTGGVFNIGWSYFHGFGQAHSQGAWWGYGYLSALFCRVVLDELASRSLAYNIRFAINAQTADTAVTTAMLTGATAYFTDQTLDPADYITPGVIETVHTTYTNNIFNTNGASGEADATDNNNFWIALAAADPTAAGDLAYNWSKDLTVSHDENAKWVIDRFIAQEAVAVSFGTRILGCYEGGTHETITSALMNDATFFAWYRAWQWGTQAADIHRIIHNELLALFDDRQFILSNFVMSGPRGARGSGLSKAGSPWSEGPWENQETAMKVMWQEFGKPL